MQFRHQRGSAEHQHIGGEKFIPELGHAVLAGGADHIDERAFALAVVVLRIGKHLGGGSIARKPPIVSDSERRFFDHAFDEIGRGVMAQRAVELNFNRQIPGQLRGIDRRNDRRAADIARRHPVSRGQIAQHRIAAFPGKGGQGIQKHQLPRNQPAVARRPAGIPPEGWCGKVDPGINAVRQGTSRH
ncbi:hypothetical protein SDC9_151044 [bioreactor metagenome]|uniref:Uncharacterized protein n=1 Tax=bioreactor metagenome TaxID=1076179 RepID=A0A645ER43_9ZZZZ